MDTDSDYIQTLHRRIEELRIENVELRTAIAKTISNGITVRGVAYEQALKDVDYKKCETCGETCIPTCPGCETSEWERTAQTYFDTMVKLEEWKAGVENSFTISLPPRTGAHTEEFYTTHKQRYLESMAENGPYADGADFMASALEGQIKIDPLKTRLQKDVDDCFCRGSDAPCIACIALTRVLGYLAAKTRTLDLP